MFKKRLASVLFFYAVLLCALVYGVVEHHLSEREFGIIAIVSMISAVVVLTGLFTKARRDHDLDAALYGDAFESENQDQLRRRIRKYRIYLALLVFILVIGLLDSRDAPLLPRIASICVNLVIIWAIVRGLQKAQKHLKG